MSTRVWFGCAGLADGVACTQRADVDLDRDVDEHGATGLPTGAARVRLAMRGWTVTDTGVWCPDHSWQAPPDAPDRADVPHRSPTSPTTWSNRRPYTGRMLAVPALPPVVLLEDDVERCGRCEDGDHHVCTHGHCGCTATSSCGARR